MSRILEQEMQAKKEQHDAQRRENEKGREVLRKASFQNELFAVKAQQNRVHLE